MPVLLRLLSANVREGRSSPGDHEPDHAPLKVRALLATVDIVIFDCVNPMIAARTHRISTRLFSCWPLRRIGVEERPNKVFRCESVLHGQDIYVQNEHRSPCVDTFFQYLSWNSIFASVVSLISNLTSSDLKGE